MRVTFYLLILILNFSPFSTKTQRLSASMWGAGLPMEVPVLCFHHIRKTVAAPDEQTISADAFRADMKMLYDSGFHSISPGQLLDYYQNAKPLPSKPFLLTFDDGNADQLENSIEVLDKYDFKGLFFIMTITIGKQNYISEEEIRLLSQWEHYIGCHTWDHQGVNSLKPKDLHWQVEKPKAYLESLTGIPIIAFAYPYGQWNEKIIPGLKRFGIKLAFQTTDSSSQHFPLYSIRRLKVSGKWNPATLLSKINSTFGIRGQF